MTPSERLEALGLRLPEPPRPAGAYRPWTLAGGIVATSGQLPLVDGRLERRGVLGAEVDTADGQSLARVCALNLLAVLADACGGIDDVEVLRLTVYVASAPGFGEQHLVANGASELIVEVLGEERGTHSRSAVGVAALPLGSPVEIDALGRAATG